MSGRGEKPDCRWREKAERERMLTRVAEDAERALRAVEQTDGLLGDERVDQAHRLLRELIGQDFDIDSDGIPRLHRGTASGRIISTVDTEMRHGRKSSRRLSELLCEAGLVGVSRGVGLRSGSSGLVVRLSSGRAFSKRSGLAGSRGR